MHTPTPIKGESDHGAPYIPTPEEISEKCEKIQRAWSSNEEQSRTVQRCPDEVAVPVIKSRPHLSPARPGRGFARD